MQRPRSTALGTRINSGMLLATFTSVFARCALRFGLAGMLHGGHMERVSPWRRAASQGGMGVIHYNLGAVVQNLAAH